MTLFSFLNTNPSLSSLLHNSGVSCSLSIVKTPCSGLRQCQVLNIYPNISVSSKVRISGNSTDRDGTLQQSRFSQENCSHSAFSKFKSRDMDSHWRCSKNWDREAITDWAQPMALLLESGYESPKLLRCSHQLAKLVVLKDLPKSCLEPVVQAQICPPLPRENNGLSSAFFFYSPTSGLHWQTPMMSPEGKEILGYMVPRI